MTLFETKTCKNCKEKINVNDEKINTAHDGEYLYGQCDKCGNWEVVNE